MPRENSFSDSEGRSLTPDLSEDEDNGVIGPSPPVATSPVSQTDARLHTTTMNSDVPTIAAPTQRHEQAPTATAAANASVTSAPSGLPPNTSPSVLFKDNTNTPLQPFTSAPAAFDSATRPNLTPADRFRASVRKVIHLTRTTSAISLGSIGAEPGIDPRRASAFVNYGHIRQKCTIEVVDYSSVRSSFGRMDNRGFVKFLSDPKACKKESWVKVRWINIGGVSWDVISALAIQFGK